jgi:serine/threonine protein kinase
MSDHLVAHLMATIEATRAISEIHELGIFHVDLNPMNILYRAQRGRPIVRIVDFESSFDQARHTKGAFYSPPTTPGYTAPEVAHQAPDARSDVFSLGAVLHTLVSGDLWVGHESIGRRIEGDDSLDPTLRDILLKAVALDPSGRYRSAPLLQRALESYLEEIWPGRSW